MKNDFPMAEKPLVYLITAGRSSDRNFNETSAQILDLVRAAVDAKISLVQLREKNLSAKNVFWLARRSSRIAERSATKILVNDRADIALAAGADGVHLTESSLAPENVRAAFPENFLIGVSAHSTEKAERAARAGADFAVLGPIFDTPGKGEPLGTDVLREAGRRLKLFPIIALGGIDETNWKLVLEAGASGFAAIRFLNDAENLKQFGEKWAAYKRG